MAATSAGILMFRRDGDGVRVLLVHPGGPFWARRDLGAWSVPKGELEPEEAPETAARREFAEETGGKAQGKLESLGEVRQKAGKRVLGFALEGDFDVLALRSAEFEMEWPPRSGLVRFFPEVDRAAWFTLEEANERIIEGQRPFLARLAALVENAGCK